MATPSPAASDAPQNAIPAPSVSPSPPLTLLSHRWVVDQRKSAMDDSVVTTFSLLGVRDSWSDRKTNDLLILRHREGRWDVVVGTNHEYLGSELPTVMLRWGQETPQQQLWQPATDFTAAFCPRPKEFILKAIESSRLVVRLYPKFSGESTVVFDLTGLDDELRKYPELRSSLKTRDVSKRPK
jgi:hypothetical protein